MKEKIIKFGFKLIIFTCMGVCTYVVFDGVNTINKIDSV